MGAASSWWCVKIYIIFDGVFMRGVVSLKAFDSCKYLGPCSRNAEISQRFDEQILRKYQDRKCGV